MKRLTAFVLAAFVSLVIVAGAPAQTGDATLDGNDHPNVGALLRARPADGSLTILCTGTLVSTHVFLTAGHCADYLLNNGQQEAYVTFDPTFGTDTTRGYKIFSTPYKGHVINNPDWHAPYQNDTAILWFDDAITGITPAKIAPLGFLDGLKQSRAIYDTPFTNVGYGTSEQVVVPTVGPTFPFDGIRKWTVSGFFALDPEFIHLSQNQTLGDSGTGYGDSGGPTFVDTANGPVVVSVVSTGDGPCYATGVNERVDIANAQNFLGPYLARG
jgi:secreted trypsin-like serine protease